MQEVNATTYKVMDRNGTQSILRLLYMINCVFLLINLGISALG